ncbi:MAG TPA: DUF4258 domain-containing protein [Tepidiformaceae bacterium]|nr:DUF4258 domain-containing protein [Tepidiformaceae bacterium]HMO94524.1 DUF4258 domain-containing protein [Tepidiformaceae bacterium]
MLNLIRKSAAEKSYLVSAHMLERLLSRGLDIADVASALASESSEVIEDYPQHHISPCCLVLCRGETGKWYHVVCSYPPNMTLITVYEPDTKEWSADLRRRIT